MAGLVLWRFADAGPQCARHHLHGAGIRKPYMSAKLSRPFRTASIGGRILLFGPLQSPSFRPDPPISQRRRAQRRSMIAVALSVLTAPQFPATPSTALPPPAGAGSPGALSPPADL